MLVVSIIEYVSVQGRSGYLVRRISLRSSFSLIITQHGLFSIVYEYTVSVCLRQAKRGRTSSSAAEIDRSIFTTFHRSTTSYAGINVSAWGVWDRIR